tara:strand:+ start:8348 stop:9322 length:975 start_codon:yes stop_codon:yes gene_type:complete
MRLAWLDLAKGIGISLVVIYHTIEGVLTSKLNPTYFEVKLAEYLSLWIIPMFFIVSGVLARKGIKYSNFNVVKFKLINWLYLYIIWSMIIYIVRLSLNNITNTDMSPEDILKIIWDPMPTIWFIYALFLCFFITWLFKKINAFVVFFIAFSAQFLNVYYSGWFPDSIFVRLAWVFPFYYFGYHFAEFILSDKISRKFEVLSLCLFLSSTICLFIFEEQVNLYLKPFVSFFLAFTFIYICRFFIGFAKYKKLSDFFTYIGSISLFVYLTHFPFPAASRILLYKLGINEVYLISMLALFLAYIIGHFSYILSKSKYGAFFFFIPNK